MNEDGQNDVEPVGKDVLIKNLRGLQQIYDLQDENHLEFSNEKMADVRFCLVYIKLFNIILIQVLKIFNKAKLKF